MNHSINQSTAQSIHPSITYLELIVCGFRFARARSLAGRPEEFAALCRAFVETGVHPDFITVDGTEGGTGAAPPEFSNSVGMPLEDGLTLAHALLIGAGLRDRVKLIAAGKVLTGFSVVKTLALGADVCNAARAMMFGECSSGVEWCGVELRE